jgi:hypothetical protein
VDDAVEGVVGVGVGETVSLDEVGEWGEPAVPLSVPLVVVTVSVEVSLLQGMPWHLHSLCPTRMTAGNKQRVACMRVNVPCSMSATANESTASSEHTAVVWMELAGRVEGKLELGRR